MADWTSTHQQFPAEGMSHSALQSCMKASKVHDCFLSSHSAGRPAGWPTAWAKFTRQYVKHKALRMLTVDRPAGRHRQVPTGCISRATLQSCMKASKLHGFYPHARPAGQQAGRQSGRVASDNLPSKKACALWQSTGRPADRASAHTQVPTG